MGGDDMKEAGQLACEVAQWRGGKEMKRRGGKGRIGSHCYGGESDLTERHLAAVKLNREEEERRVAGSDGPGENDDDGKKRKTTWLVCMLREIV
jgi:hypothetical protein